MKQFTVIIHPGAFDDVRAAYLWIVERSPNGAARWHAGLMDFVKSLETFPESHPFAPEDQELEAGVRQALYIRPGSTYRLLFVVEAASVNVVAVRHGARDDLDPGTLRTLLQDATDEPSAGT